MCGFRKERIKFMKEIILCKYGEIALKGLNKSSFESMMTKSVKRRLKSCGQFSVSKAQSTLYVEPLNDDSDVDMAVEKLSKIFGIDVGLSRAPAPTHLCLQFVRRKIAVALCGFYFV